MTGTVYLGGGGSPQDEAPLWREMLGGCRSILYWPFALSEPMLGAAEEWLASSLARYEYDGRLETWPTLAGKDASQLAAFDLLFVGGGNTFDLLQEIRSHDFLEPVRGFVRAGGSYYGGSAGAIVACDEIAIAAWHDADDIGLTDLSALGLVSDLAVLPHYQPGWRNDAQRWAQDHEMTLLALPERTGLIVSGGTQRVVGQESAWIFSGAQSRENPPGSALASGDRRA